MFYPWFINRAPMGRARFMVYPWFFNRAAIGRARFLVYSCFFFNRAAIGRAQFMVYPWLFFNHAAMGRARFMFYPWFINRAAMGRARFLVYPWFFFFADLSAIRPKLPLGQILTHATCDVYSPKAVQTLIKLISDTDFRGKKLKTQRSSKIIFFQQKFSSEHIHIYICLNRR